MNTYACFCNGLAVQLEEDTLWGAKKKFIAEYKIPKKSLGLVSVHLVKKGDEEVPIYLDN